MVSEKDKDSPAVKGPDKVQTPAESAQRNQPNVVNLDEVPAGKTPTKGSDTTIRTSNDRLDTEKNPKAENEEPGRTEEEKHTTEEPYPPNLNDSYPADDLLTKAALLREFDYQKQANANDPEKAEKQADKQRQMIDDAQDGVSKRKVRVNKIFAKAMEDLAKEFEGIDSDSLRRAVMTLDQARNFFITFS